MQQIIVGTNHIQVQIFGVCDQRLQDGVDGRQVLGLANFLYIARDFGMVIAGAFRHFTDTRDKHSHQTFQRCFGFVQTVFERTLLEHHFFDAQFGIVNDGGCQRATDNVLHDVELAVQPLIIHEQFGDVLDEQA